MSTAAPSTPTPAPLLLLLLLPSTPSSPSTPSPTCSLCVEAAQLVALSNKTILIKFLVVNKCKKLLTDPETQCSADLLTSGSSTAMAQKYVVYCQAAFQVVHPNQFAAKTQRISLSCLCSINSLGLSVSSVSLLPLSLFCLCLSVPSLPQLPLSSIFLPFHSSVYKLQYP